MSGSAGVGDGRPVAGDGGPGASDGAAASGGAPSFRVWALGGIPEVRAGDDLAKLIAAAEPGLVDGDILLVTSKIVSKAEGRVLRAADREAAIDAETVRVVARRGTLRIVENRQGLVLAAAGVDASNTLGRDRTAAAGGFRRLRPGHPGRVAGHPRRGGRRRRHGHLRAALAQRADRRRDRGGGGAGAGRSAGRDGRVRQSAQRHGRGHGRRAGRGRGPGQGQGGGAAGRRGAGAAACGVPRRRGLRRCSCARTGCGRRHVPARDVGGGP